MGRNVSGNLGLYKYLWPGSVCRSRNLVSLQGDKLLIVQNLFKAKTFLSKNIELTSNITSLQSRNL